jgi:hypothetical protein
MFVEVPDNVIKNLSDSFGLHCDYGCKDEFEGDFCFFDLVEGDKHNTTFIDELPNEEPPTVCPNRRCKTCKMWKYNSSISCFDHLRGFAEYIEAINVRKIQSLNSPSTFNSVFTTPDRLHSVIEPNANMQEYLHSLTVKTNLKLRTKIAANQSTISSQNLANQELRRELQSLKIQNIRLQNQIRNPKLKFRDKSSQTFSDNTTTVETVIPDQDPQQTNSFNFVTNPTDDVPKTKIQLIQIFHKDFVTPRICNTFNNKMTWNELKSESLKLFPEIQNPSDYELMSARIRIESFGDNGDKPISGKTLPTMALNLIERDKIQPQLSYKIFTSQLEPIFKPSELIRQFEISEFLSQITPEPNAVSNIISPETSAIYAQNILSQRVPITATITNEFQSQPILPLSYLRPQLAPISYNSRSPTNMWMNRFPATNRQEHQWKRKICRKHGKQYCSGHSCDCNR